MASLQFRELLRADRHVGHPRLPSPAFCARVHEYYDAQDGSQSVHFSLPLSDPLYTERAAVIYPGSGVTHREFIAALVRGLVSLGARSANDL